MREVDNIFDYMNETDDPNHIRKYLLASNDDRVILISDKYDEVCPEMVSEIVGDEEMLFFSSKVACENYVLKDFNKWKSEVIE